MRRYRKHTWAMIDTKAGRAPKPFLHPLALALVLALVPVVVAQAPAPAPTRATAPVQAPAPAIASESSAAAPPTNVRTDAPVPAYVAELETLAQNTVAQTGIPGLAMVIVQGGRVVSVRGYGVTDTQTRQPVSADTVFRLASLSKAFASTMSALLVSEGAMSWDQPIINQLPAFKLQDYAGSQRVTVRDVLSHRVGLRYNTYDRDLESDQPYPLLAERLSDAPMHCAPGDCYAYQNIAFSLIGDLVFAATGDFYSHQVEKRLFHPLGMFDSTYGREGLEASASWARPHIRSGQSWTPVRPRETYYRVPPAAGVNASARDMGQWLLAQLGHRPDVLSRDIIQTIQTPLVLTEGELRSSPWRRERLRSAYYALGWRVYDYSGHRLVFHGGAVQGYRAMAALMPERDVGLVVLWNSESAAPSGLLPTLMDRVLGLPYTDWLELHKYRPSRPARRRAR